MHAHLRAPSSLGLAAAFMDAETSPTDGFDYPAACANLLDPTAERCWQKTRKLVNSVLFSLVFEFLAGEHADVCWLIG